MTKIIISPNNFKENLISFYRKDDPFFDVSIFSKQDLINALYPKVKKDTIVRLMKQFNISYSSASRYAKLVRYLDESNKNEVGELTKYYDFIKENNLFLYDEFAKEVFKGKDIEIIGYQKDDKFLQKLLKKLQIDDILNKTADEKEPSLVDKTVYIYDTLENEAHFLFVKILDLIKEGVDINDIYIYGYRDSYKFYFDYYSKLYDIKLNNFASDNFINLGFVKKFITDYKENNDINLCFKELDGLNIDEDILIKFKNIIESNTYDFLNVSQQIDVYKNVLNTPYRNDIYDKAITIINDEINVSDKHIFCIGFDQNNYPKVKSDDDIIFDSDKEKIDIATSKDESEELRYSLYNFLASDNNFYFSFAMKSYTENFYLSFIASSNNFKQIYIKDPLDHDYSYNASLNSATKLEDINSSLNVFSPYLNTYRSVLDYKYNSFDNTFKSFKIYDENSELYYSYSSLKEYAECPFKYYLDKVLNIGDESSNSAADIGSFVHKVYEYQFKNLNDDFNTCYQMALECDDYVLDDRTKMLINGNKTRIEDVFNFNKQHFNNINNPKVYLEKKYKTTLENPKSNLKGYVDKLMIINNQYYVIIDYKTSSESLKEKLFEYDLGLQLPAYAYLLEKAKNSDEQLKDLKDIKLGGIYYQSIFDQVKLRDEKYYKLSGVSLNDETFLTKFSANVFTKANTKDEESLKEYIKIADASYNKLDNQIRNNIFDINPIHTSDVDGCKYCSFKDVCFVKDKDYKKEIKEEVITSDE